MTEDLSFVPGGQPALHTGTDYRVPGAEARLRGSKVE